MSKMESLLSMLLEMRSELKQIRKTLEELKAENKILRKEIFGVRNSSDGSDNSEGLMTTETLRELIEKIQFDIGKMKEAAQTEKSNTYDVRCGQSGSSQVSFGKRNHGTTEIEIIVKKPKTTVSSVFGSTTRSAQEYTPGQIRTKDEERRRLLARGNEFMLYPKWKNMKNGFTLTGTTLESISSSIRSKKFTSSIILVISNHLPLSITSVTKFRIRGAITGGPTEIESNTKEVFSMKGDSELHYMFMQTECTFLYSFKISETLRLAVQCHTNTRGAISLDAGFTPPDIPVDSSLLSNLRENACLSVDCFSTQGELELSGAKCIISNGNYLAHIITTTGPHSIVHVDIWEQKVPLEPIAKSIQGIKNGESVQDAMVVEYLSQTTNPLEDVTVRPYACVVQIVNGLGVSLKNGQTFMRRRYTNIAHERALERKRKASPMPKEVFSLTTEMFAVVDNLEADGIFLYEIEESDLSILVAFKCQRGKNNSFCATITPIRVQLNEVELNNYMNPSKTWATLECRRYAQAEDGEQLIAARNLRVTASMTTGKISILKFVLFSALANP